MIAEANPFLAGVVHLPALPGAPRYAGSMDTVIERALHDARTYEHGGMDALIIENFGDAPFTAGTVEPETLAAMACAAQAIKEEISIPYGFNVLRNDAHSALALCAAAGGTFIRVNVHSGAMVTDQGIIQGQAYSTMRKRAAICPAVRVFADILVKHAAPLGEAPIEKAALDTLQRGQADGLIVSGWGTGAAVVEEDLKAVRGVCPNAFLLVGSGANVENVKDLLAYADGVIVGSSLKYDGHLTNPVDFDRVQAFVAAARGLDD